ncbi:MAG: hypothetical protein ACJ8CB_30580 [Ktedonobacteraceae bacterium]
MANTSLNVRRSRAGQLKGLRTGLLKQLFAKPRLVDTNPQTQVLNDIASSFSRFAAYQQTAFDSGASRSSSSNDANSMERQVQRVFNQVLGGATGRGSNSFMTALNNAFPTTATTEGQQVVLTPARSMVSLYRSDGSMNGASPMNDYSIGTTSADGFAGTISARQANLYREASIIAGDALRVLNGLTAFVPEAEADQMDALKALIGSEINVLVEEFGRVDEPRNERVLAYFSALNIHVKGLGERAFLDDPTRAATVDDEAQLAGFELLNNYSRTLREVWNTFFNVDRKSTTSFSLSERVERANILLPIVAQVNVDFEAAMDSVGFTESERRSLAAKFNTLTGFKVSPLSAVFNRQQDVFVEAEPDDFSASLPDITVYDLTEWVDRFANLESPNMLANSGLYGLDFVTDQADRIFWVIAPVVAILETDEVNLASNSSSLEQSLSNERVRFSLNNLLFQLNALADLSVSGGS